MANGYDQHSLAHVGALSNKRGAVPALSPLEDPRETVNASSSAITTSCMQEASRTAGMDAGSAVTSLREAAKDSKSSSSSSSSGGNPFAKKSDDEEDEDEKKKAKKGSSSSSGDSDSSSSSKSSSSSSKK